MNESTHPKGSKGMIQILVEEHKDLLDKVLGVKLKWICPIKEDNFKELQLNGEKMCGELGLSREDFEDFWPSRQPQWDGIAKDENNNLYLIEAKSHLDEICPGNREPDGSNQEQNKNYGMKRESLLCIKKHYNSNKENKLWLHKYYQISNRLAFLKKMKELRNKKKTDYNDVKLIFLNFKNDTTWGKKAVKCDEWIKKYDKIWDELGVNKNMLEEEGVLIIDIDGKDF